jgi:hypothetical protein
VLNILRYSAGSTAVTPLDRTHLIPFVSPALLLQFSRYSSSVGEDVEEQKQGMQERVEQGRKRRLRLFVGVNEPR